MTEDGALAEAQLREKEEQYRSIFEAISDSVVIFDMNGVIVEANPVACRLYGYRYDELVGLHVGAIIPDYADLEAPL